MEKNKKEKLATRLDLFVSIGLACCTFIILMLVIEYAHLSLLFAGVSSVFFYLLCLSIWAVFRMKRNLTASNALTLDLMFSSGFGEAIEQVKHPIVICNSDGDIRWANRAFTRLAGANRVFIGKSLSLLCGVVLTPDAGRIVCIADRYFSYDPSPCVYNGDDFWMIIFHDCTDELALEGKYLDERTAVAYAIVDNMDEISQYVQDDVIKAANDVGEKLKKWVDSMHGIIRAYERNKYLILFDVQHLDRCMEERFAILDDVRAVHVGDGVSITVSMGITKMGETLLERESIAQNALDMALQRGGDQVVYKSDDGVEFFGGKTKAGYKRTSVLSRVMATQLASLMGRANNVLIMGHRYGDYDSFGASVGMARLAKTYGLSSRIIVNKNDPNLRLCLDKLSGISSYRDMFIDSADALDFLEPDTLVIVVDVNNFKIVECPEVVEKANHVVVIDHHIKVSETRSNIELEYIEPTASSASELVSEFLEQNNLAKKLLKEEAELLLSGILLDTKQFTRNTGTRTFAMAQFLRSEGANPGETQELFQTDVEELTKEARFHANVVIYKRRIAVTSCENDTDGSYRVIAAKVADKLLTIRDVEASFVLVKIDDRIHISARSNGSINVQLILERLNGGGHFDVAGAQISNDTMKNVIERLRDSIDENLENLKENMI